MPIDDLFTATDFASPALFMALPLVAVYVVVLVFASRAPLKKGASIALSLFRWCLLAGILVFLAAPFVKTETKLAPRFEIALDVSRSVTPDARSWMGQEVTALVEELRQSEPETTIKVVAFAGRTKVLYEGRADAFDLNAIMSDFDIEGVDSYDSRLGPALAALDSTRRSSVESLRLIITDGALEAPGRLDGGYPHKTLFLPTPSTLDFDVVATQLEVDALHEEGAGLPFVLRCRSPRDIEVPLSIAIDGQVVREVPVALTAGETRVAIAGRDIAARPGSHRLDVSLSCDDDEAQNNRLSAGFRVLAKTRVVYVRGDHKGQRDPAPLRALRAQDHDVVETTAEALRFDDAFIAQTRAIVWDRVNPRTLAPEQTSRWAQALDEGVGLVVFPRGEPAELLAWNESPLGPFLPLRGLPEPPPPKKEPKPEKEEENDPKKLAEADPEKSRLKEVEAPTLAVVIVIDKSPSMKRESRLHHAKLGALATARELHPDDRIGIITFSETPTEVVPIQPAKNLGAIEAEVMRIKAGGRATDIERALKLAQRVLSVEDVAVKTVILLSDGLAIPFDVKATLQTLVSDGISVSTVGVGSEFDYQTLTEIAIAGQGTGAIPARSAKEIPAVLIDLTTGIIDDEGARNRKDFDRKEAEKNDRINRPERKKDPEAAPKEPTSTSDQKSEKPAISFSPQRPVTYTDDLPWGLAPPLSSIHRSAAKNGAWVALSAEPKRPLLAHWRVGDGVAAMMASPPEGAFVGDLPLWDGYGVFISQLIHFVEADPRSERLRVIGRAEADRVDLHCVDAWSRDTTTPWAVSCEDEMGPLSVTAAQALGESRFRYQLDRAVVGHWLAVIARSPDDAQAQAEAIIAVAPPREIRNRGLDLVMMARWRDALGGKVVVDRSEVAVHFPQSVRREQSQPVGIQGLIGLVFLFFCDLMAKRFLRREGVVS